MQYICWRKKKKNAITFLVIRNIPDDYFLYSFLRYLPLDTWSTRTRLRVNLLLVLSLVYVRVNLLLVEGLKRVWKRDSTKVEKFAPDKLRDTAIFHRPPHILHASFPRFLIPLSVRTTANWLLFGDTWLRARIQLWRPLQTLAAILPSDAASSNWKSIKTLPLPPPSF